MEDCSKGLKYLLDLDGTKYFLNGERFYIELSIKVVEKNIHIPHGYKYNFTLHDVSLKPNTTRIYGIDNAHGGNYGYGKHSSRPNEWDHMHHYNDNPTIYTFTSGEELLIDFNNGVKSVLDALGFHNLFV